MLTDEQVAALQRQTETSLAVTTGWVSIETYELAALLAERAQWAQWAPVVEAGLEWRARCRRRPGFSTDDPAAWDAFMAALAALEDWA